MELIEKANLQDLSEILALQKLAYISEAELVNDFTIQPLTQTIYELEKEYDSGVILKIVDKQKIVGSIRANLVDDVVQIGKLMVHPEYQKQGMGSKLLLEIEQYFAGNKVFELFTSSLSERNIGLYKKNGYEEFAEKNLKPHLKMTFLRKNK